jgi:hypothetical protein
MAASVQATASAERDWLRRAVLVLLQPRAVFAALRDDSEEAAQARQEPVLALILLAGIAGVLASPVARSLLDDPARDGLVVAVWAFIGGLFYGVAGYWLLGGLLHAATRAFGTDGTYRRARHVLAFAVAPVALSLVTLWPVALAAFGGDLFRSGGSGHGVVGWAAAAFGVWALVLLALGVRVAYAWRWAESLATVAIVAALVAAVVVATR